MNVVHTSACANRGMKREPPLEYGRLSCSSCDVEGDDGNRICAAAAGGRRMGWVLVDVRRASRAGFMIIEAMGSNEMCLATAEV